MTEQIKAADVVEEARKCLGVKFVHQGRHPKGGLDCIGLVLWSLCRCGWNPVRPELTLDATYRKIPEDMALKNSIEAEGVPVSLDSVKPGDVLLMLWSNEQYPRHLALVTGTEPLLSIIHTDWTYGRVVEHFLQEGLLHSVMGAYRIHGVEA